MDFTKYRPADDSSAAIHAARLLAAQDYEGTAAATAAAKDERDSLLLDGDPKALKAAEDKLRSARDNVERLEAISAQLAERHEQALRREAIGRVEQAKAEVTAARRAVLDFWEQEGKALTEMLRRSQELNLALDSTEYRLSLSRRRAFDAYPDDVELQQAASAGVENGVDFPPEVEEWRQMIDRAQPFLLGQTEHVPPASDSLEKQPERDPEPASMIATASRFLRNRAAPAS